MKPRLSDVVPDKLSDFPESEAGRVRLALEILRTVGWYQGSLQGPDGSVCISGALQAARVNCYTLGTVSRTVEDLFPGNDTNTIHTIFGTWNDRPERTYEDIELVLKHAVERLEEEDSQRRSLRAQGSFHSPLPKE